MKGITNKKKLLREMNKIAQQEECWNCEKDVIMINKEGRRLCPKCRYYQ